MRKIVLAVALILLLGFVLAECEIDVFSAQGILTGERTNITYSCTADISADIIINDEIGNVVDSQNVPCTSTQNKLEKIVSLEQGLYEAQIIKSSDSSCRKSNYFAVKEKKEISIPDSGIVAAFISVFLVLLIVSVRKKQS